MENINRTTIELGEAKLEVFKMPDGSYWYSKTDIEATLGFEPTRRAYRDFLKSKDTKALQASSLATGNVKIKYIGNTYTLVTQREVVLFWGFQAKNGNGDAVNLLSACAEEALERRADAAFGVTVPEVQRQERLQERIAPKLSEKIRKDRQKLLNKIFMRQSAAGQNLGKEMTILVNQAVFGQDHFKCQRSKYMPKETQYAVGEIEKYIIEAHFQNPHINVRSQVEDAIKIHKNIYGDRYFLPENKVASVS